MKVNDDCRTCGHPLTDHSPSLRCRTCERECGIDCTDTILRRRR